MTLLVQLGAGGSGDLQARLALVPADPRLPALLGHLFLHGGWLSLLGTLFFLAAAGPWLEAQLGRPLFAMSLASAGLAGALLFVSLQPESGAPWRGASAATGGALGLLALAARGAPADLLGVLAGRAGSLVAPGWALAALWLGGELAGLVQGTGDAVAAHAAGFGFGVALAFGFEKTGVIESRAAQRGARPSRRTQRSRAPLAVPQHPAQLEALLSEATHPAHARAYLAHAEAQGRLDRARGVVAQRLAEALEWRRREPAMALWCALLSTGPAPSVGTDELLQLASWLRGAGHAAEATSALHAALARADAVAAAKIARAARRSDAVICYRAAERALEDGTLDVSDRKALEGLRSEAERELTARGIILVPAGAQPARPAPAAPPREPSNAARALAPGEAIELPPESPALPTALPDPERSGEAAFLDAFHAALHEGVGEEAKEAAPLRRLRVREATPRALEDDTLVIEVAGRGALRLRLTRVHAVALAAVRGISARAGDKPVLLVDLCLSNEAEPELQVLRLRSDRFDPRRLVPGSEPSPLAALRSFVSALAEAAHAPLLPAADVVSDAPVRIYRDLETYQRDVLGAA